MSGEQTYIELTRSAIEAIESALRTQFKADNSAPIPLTYRDRTYNLRNRSARILVAAAISDDYVREHGEFNQQALDAWYEKGEQGQRPSPVSVDTALLDRLTDALLHEELTDERPDKMTLEEYPIMSEHQEERRRDNEYADVLAESYDSSGKNRAEPVRRIRIARERYFVDQLASRQNRERNAQYRRDTSPGLVTEGAGTSFEQCSGIAEKWRSFTGRGEVVEEKPALLPHK
ncbi:hypothetical protein GCM10008933_00080 [Paenibacillus motobuensis]|uniref:Large polyvalent protein associated domain-containing protein n=2 Tax=Paenibacillus motobuensis TaxID=295324 RepID=A0ABN0XUD7_9BACL